MPVTSDDIKNRWDRIRKNDACDLELTPEAVSEYLSPPESDLVLRRIRESLVQFARYRLEKGFVSREPAAPGDLATCEGLEAFLIPAVQSALPFSQFLQALHDKGKEIASSFSQAFTEDLQGLVKNWVDGKFSGNPYADDGKIRDAVKPILQGQFRNVNITESAAMACRILIHVLTLKLKRPEEDRFREEIGAHLKDADMIDALSKAIDFLVGAFQKINGPDEEYPIAGWSWTSRQGLPPMLFFTASAVEAFAELDLYLIRPALTKEFAKNTESEKLADFYSQNESKLMQFQHCVEMARRWVQKAVLPDLSFGYGQHAEEFPDRTKLKYRTDQEGYANFKQDLDRVDGMHYPPMVFYNSLYALIILLWSWGDWSDDGYRPDEEARNRINRALAQVVYNYANIPVVKEVLNKFPYIFYLPGEGIFQPGNEEKCSYLDAGFPPLLTRVLVLFVVYGVGDRNLLEPVIRELYVELLQSRNRRNFDYSELWASEGIEVFSTQRAIQALTFYYAYARGKELVERRDGGKELLVDRGDRGELILLRNKTGFPLVLEAMTDRPIEFPKPPPEAEEIKQAPEKIKAETFALYCKDKEEVPGWQWHQPVDGHEKDFLFDVAKLGDLILKAVKEGTARANAARLILNRLADLSARPTAEMAIRKPELEMLRQQYADLISAARAH